jgi:hypothetical protein
MQWTPLAPHLYVYCFCKVRSTLGWTSTYTLELASEKWTIEKWLMKPQTKIELTDRAMLLVIVKGGKVIHYSGNLLLSHVEFVKRKTGELPEGAWVGTVHKTDEGIMAFTSKTFYGYEQLAPEPILRAMREAFQ